MPFGQVPILEMNGIRLAQSSAIHRYLVGSVLYLLSLPSARIWTSFRVYFV
jgi:glutathione S-transferase